MAFKRTFIIINVLMIAIGVLLVLNAKQSITGAVVGTVISPERATFFGTVFIFLGLLMFLVESSRQP